MNSSEYMLLRSGDLNCPYHINRELEFVYVKKGRMTVYYDTETVEVFEGEVALVLPFSLHGFKMNEDTKATVFMFPESVFESFFESSDRLGKEGKFKLATPAAEFAEYISQKPKLSAADIRAVFYTLFSEVHTAGSIRHITSDNRKKVMEYIYKNISDHLSLDVLSKELGIGKKKISDIVRSGHGVGFLGFISNVRIEKSKLLLASTDKTVIEIAFECGFGSVRTFNRVFAGKTGRTPVEYRKSIT